MAYAALKASSLRWLSFAGAENENVFRFVEHVRAMADAQSPPVDDQWTAAYVAGCLKGTALIWHSTLDEDIQSDWSELREALLQRFIPRGAIDADVNLFSRDCRGTIMVIDRADSRCYGYLSPLPSTIFTRDVKQALTVKIPASVLLDKPLRLEMLSGAIFKRRATAMADHDGLASSLVWTIRPLDPGLNYELQIQWMDNSGTTSTLVPNCFDARDAAIAADIKLPRSDWPSGRDTYDSSEGRDFGATEDQAPAAESMNMPRRVMGAYATLAPVVSEKGRKLVVCKEESQSLSIFRKCRPVRLLFRPM
ncbi:hypothetical protein FRB99_003790 [Tulasnella sp. 403]|nr:hypothetical protein FRB99_003790 [Tulasnella sp. 403]